MDLWTVIKFLLQINVINNHMHLLFHIYGDVDFSEEISRSRIVKIKTYFFMISVRGDIFFAFLAQCIGLIFANGVRYFSIFASLIR